MPDRYEQVAAFYTAEADNLEASVARVVYATPTIVEDVCQHAWCQLLRHGEIRLDCEGFCWLRKVAIRMAWRMTALDRRVITIEVPSNELGGLPEELVAGLDDIAATVERHEDLALIDRLPARQRQLIFLSACGFSVAEMARITRGSERTVERQLHRGRRTLRRWRAGNRIGRW